MKIFSTIRLLYPLFCARVFGKYQHSGWDGTVHYHVYLWRDHMWFIPASPIDDQ